MTSETSKSAFSTRHMLAALFAIFAIWILKLLAPTSLAPTSLAPTEPSPIAKFAAITNEAFEQINTFDLPATYVIMDHTVACRRTANIVERSSAFEKSGAQIVIGLRNFGEKVMEAGNALQAMYRKGSYVFETFQTEFQMILDNESKFSDSSIERLIRLFTEFRETAIQVASSIADAKKVHENLEQHLLDGQKEVAKSITADDEIGAMAIKDELDSIKAIFVHIQKAGTNFDMTVGVLRDYLSKASKINASLGKGVYLATEKESNCLEKSLEDLRVHHKNFMLKDSSIDEV